MTIICASQRYLISVSRFLLDHASGLQHIGPFSTSAGVAVLKMLAEVVCTEELLGRVALSKLVNLLQVSNACVPVLIGSYLALPRRRGRSGTMEVFPTVPTSVSLAWVVGGLMKGPVIAGQY
jgi:hypothetical protein